jgi:outer membrane lipoprotein carrier protein
MDAASGLTRPLPALSFGMHRLTLTLALAGTCLGAGSDSLWLNLRQRYLTLRTLSGTFEERICSEEAGTCQTFEGKFSIRAPARYRLQVTEPVNQLIVSDSTDLWIFLPDEKRAVRQPAGGFAPVLAFLGPILDSTTTAEFERDSGGFYTARVNSGEEMSALADLVLELDKTATRVQGFSFTDPWGLAYHFALTRQVWNPRLADKLFRFTPPKGVSVEQ